MNPEYCFIQRQENGWLLVEEKPCRITRGAGYVFQTPKQLAAFIEEHFRLPVKKPVEGGK